MAKRGIDNVLGSLIGPEESEIAEKPEPKAKPGEAAIAIPSSSLLQPPEPEKTITPARLPRGARRGRPPGSKAGEGGGKVKKLSVQWFADQPNEGKLRSQEVNLLRSAKN